MGSSFALQGVKPKPPEFRARTLSHLITRKVPFVVVFFFKSSFNAVFQDDSRAPFAICMFPFHFLLAGTQSHEQTKPPRFWEM